MFYNTIYMFLKKKKKIDLNNNSLNGMLKPRKHILELIETIKSTPTPLPKTDFVKPTTEEGWVEFHKINEEGMKLAYASKEGYHIDNNRLFISGTRDLTDILDWSKIVTKNFKNSKIYKNADKVFKDNDKIDYVVGHSAGGSATLELEKNIQIEK